MTGHRNQGSGWSWELTGPCTGTRESRLCSGAGVCVYVCAHMHTARLGQSSCLPQSGGPRLGSFPAHSRYVRTAGAMCPCTERAGEPEPQSRRCTAAEPAQLGRCSAISNSASGPFLPEKSLGKIKYHKAKGPEGYASM